MVIIIVAVIGSPFFVNFLFQKDAPIDVFAARYSAGDLLTYISGVMALVGTFFLGLVSFYQTQQSNKIAENSAKLAKKANEISLIERIVDQEINMYNNLQTCLDDYSRICLPQNVLALRIMLTDSQDKVTMEGMKVLINRRNELIGVFNLVGRCLRQDRVLKQDDTDVFKESYAYIFRWTLDYIDHYTQKFPTTREEYTNEKISAYQKYYEEVFMVKREKYLEKYEQRISRLLYEDHTIEDVRDICNMK